MRVDRANGANGEHALVRSEGGAKVVSLVHVAHVVHVDVVLGYIHRKGLLLAAMAILRCLIMGSRWDDLEEVAYRQLSSRALFTER